MDNWTAVIGTLLGAVLGASGAYVAQRLNYRAQKKDRFAEAQREAYARWLIEIHRLEIGLKAIHIRHAAGRVSAEARDEEVAALTWVDAQSRLEELRLLASNAAASASTTLWRHMGKNPEQAGDDSDYEGWREKYWELRRMFVNTARAELGLAPIPFAAE